MIVLVLGAHRDAGLATSHLLVIGDGLLPAAVQVDRLIFLLHRYSFLRDLNVLGAKGFGRGLRFPNRQIR